MIDKKIFFVYSGLFMFISLTFLSSFAFAVDYSPECDGVFSLDPTLACHVVTDSGFNVNVNYMSWTVEGEEIEPVLVVNNMTYKKSVGSSVSLYDGKVILSVLNISGNVDNPAVVLMVEDNEDYVDDCTDGCPSSGSSGGGGSVSFCGDDQYLDVGESCVYETDGVYYSVGYSSWTGSGDDRKVILEIDGMVYTKSAGSFITLDDNVVVNIVSIDGTEDPTVYLSFGSVEDSEPSDGYGSGGGVYLGICDGVQSLGVGDSCLYTYGHFYNITYSSWSGSGDDKKVILNIDKYYSADDLTYAKSVGSTITLGEDAYIEVTSIDGTIDPAVVLSFFRFECIDSDGGVNEFVKGNVTDTSDGHYEVDECYSDRSLLEYTCDGRKFWVHQIQCNIRCEDGICVDTPEPYELTGDIDLDYVHCRDDQNLALSGACVFNSVENKYLISYVSWSDSGNERSVVIDVDGKAYSRTAGSFITLDDNFVVDIVSINKTTDPIIRLSFRSVEDVEPSVGEDSGSGGSVSICDDDQSLDVGESCIYETDDVYYRVGYSSWTGSGDDKKVILEVDGLVYTKRAGSFISLDDGLVVNIVSIDDTADHAVYLSFESVEDAEPSVGDGSGSGGSVSYCDGCLYNNSCYPVGSRFDHGGNSSYCSVDSVIDVQLGDGGRCNNDYECRTNFCTNDVCVDIDQKVDENKSILDRILAFLGSIFG